MDSPTTRNGLSNRTIVLLIAGAGLALVVLAAATAAIYWQVNRRQAADRGNDAQSDEGSIASIAPPRQKAYISEEELNAFADKVQSAMQAGDVAAATELFDSAALVDTALAGLDTSSKEVREIRRGMELGMSSDGIVPQIATAIKDGSYTFLHVRDVDDRPRLLFRLLLGSGGFNYHELVVDRGRDDEIRAMDVYVYTSGEFVSQSMRRMLAPALAQLDRSWLDKLSQSDQELVRHYKSLTEINRLVGGGSDAEAIRMLDTLPLPLQQLKPMRLIRVTSSASIDNATYMAAIEDYRRTYPNDPSLPMIEIDYYILRKEFAEAMQAIDRLDKAIGGDPYLECLRANVSIGGENWDAARRHAEQSIAAEPTLQAPYWSLVTIGLTRPDHDLALDTLKKMDQAFQMQWADMTQVPDYAGFVQSPAYQQWQEYLATKDSPPAEVDQAPLE